MTTEGVYEKSTFEFLKDMTTHPPIAKNRPKSLSEPEALKAILKLKSEEKMSLRKIAKHFDGGVTYGDIERIIKYQIFPKKKEKRIALYLSPLSSVTAIENPVPEGSQVLSARQCECGQFYIPNHPLRAHCYSCHKPRSKKVVV